MNLKEMALQALQADKDIVESGINMELLADLVEPQGEPPEGSTPEQIKIHKENQEKLKENIIDSWNAKIYATNAFFFIEKVRIAKREGQDISWLDAIPHSEEIFKNLKI
jgi:hypothetical protein